MKKSYNEKANNDFITWLIQPGMLFIFSFQVLNLAKTDIDSIPLDAFRGLVNLRQLDLSDNRFTEVPESLSLVGSTLKYLTFNNNPLVELNDDSFIGKFNKYEGMRALQLRLKFVSYEKNTFVQRYARLSGLFS